MAEQNTNGMISAYNENIMLFGCESAHLFSRGLTASKLRIKFESLV